MTGLKSGDLVKVITGKFRGLVDKIQHLERKKEKVYLAKATREIYNKSPEVKKKSQLKKILVPIHISNVVIWKKKKSSRTEREK